MKTRQRRGRRSEPRGGPSRGTPPRRLPKESESDYLIRLLSKQPSVIPLPKLRGMGHPNFREFKGGEMWWLHHDIPSCMLTNALS
jgi:hypothetical protein